MTLAKAAEEAGLYAGLFSRYTKHLEESLSEPRFAHSLQTAALTAALLQKEDYPSPDIEKGIIAALLHDVTKEYDDDAHRRLFAEYDRIDLYDSLPKEVYHAYTGSYLIENQFGITAPSILFAVRYHTTGHPGLDHIGKAVFAADMLSVFSDRKIEIALEGSMDQICLDKATYAIKTLVHRRRPIHEDTTRFYNELTKHVPS